MRELGMNAVKLWVQWRWSHRRGDRFQFDDVDRLMDLAAENRLGVTLNVIFDVTPVWLFEEFPDARQVNARGQVILPSPLYLSDAEAAALDRRVRAGGVVLCEAHLGAYSATTGRHARELPVGEIIRARRHGGTVRGQRSCSVRSSASVWRRRSAISAASRAKTRTPKAESARERALKQLRGRM